MSTPKYADLNKAVTDLFKDDFGFGQTKLTLKSKSDSGATFKVEGTKSAKGDVGGFLETKFTHSGVTIKEKWGTCNNVTSEFSWDNTFVSGSKVTADVVFNPVKGLEGLKLTLKNDFVKNNLNANITVDNAGLLKSSAVFKFCSNYLAGVTAEYSSATSSLSNTNATLSYVEKDVIVTTSVTSGSNVEGSIFQNVNPKVNAGLKFSWNQANATEFAVCGSYKIDNSSFVKAKICKSLNLGLGYTQELASGVKVTWAANVKAGDLAGDAHSLGLALEFNQ